MSTPPASAPRREARFSRRLAVLVLASVVIAGIAASAVAPHPRAEQFRDQVFAPPMKVRMVDPDGRWRAPFVYPLRLADRLERRYEEDRSRPATLRWFRDGTLISADRDVPVFLLGTDSLGRDIFSRLVHAARTSLGVAAVATGLALLIGLFAGGLAGYAGGWTDEVVMRSSEFVLVLPAIYLVLALRAAMPLVLPPMVVFLLMAGILGLVGWPPVARGVRAIVAAERRRDYALAAVALGAGPTRVLMRHLLPATRGFLAAQGTLLVPAFILAEATLSFVGLGFAEPVPSWGSMLREAANIHAMADFPWLLSPAVVIVAVVLSVNLLVRTRTRAQSLALLGRSDRLS
jgi:peptide/nickel transport system permease protein